MAVLNIRDETYQQLASKAASANITVEALVEPALIELARDTPLTEPTSADSEREYRRQAFEQWQKAVAQRASRYPADHVLDDSRESIYAGREERGR
jgi:hypothetical protein